MSWKVFITKTCTRPQFQYFVFANGNEILYIFNASFVEIITKPISGFRTKTIISLNEIYVINKYNLSNLLLGFDV